MHNIAVNEKFENKMFKGTKRTFFNSGSMH